MVGTRGKGEATTGTNHVGFRAWSRRRDEHTVASVHGAEARQAARKDHPFDNPEDLTYAESCL
jgi:hypothetical protein